jgi:hypothetical protein
MNTLGTVKGTDTSKSFRQFIVNCLGENDRRKFYLITPFGMDSNPPEGVKALTSDSKNKDDKFVMGFLNALKLDDLAPGEQIIFSAASDGSEVKAFIKLLNTGIMHLNGDADFLAGYTKLKEGFDQLKSDFNNLVTAYNSHMHPTAATGPASPPTVSGTSSTASIDDSKKANLKCE